jgi:hypothetical protein
MADRITIYDNLKERGLNFWDALSRSADEYFSSKPSFSPSQPFDMRHYVDGNYLPPLQDSVQRDVGNAVAKGVLDTVTDPVGYVKDLYYGIADPAVSAYQNTSASLPYYGNAALQRLRGDDNTEAMNIADKYSANAITSLGLLGLGIADVLPSGKVTKPVKGLLDEPNVSNRITVSENPPETVGRISTRQPTAKNIVDTGLNGDLIIDTKSMVEGGTLKNNLDFVSNYSGMQALKGMNPEEGAKYLQEMQKANLRFVTDRLPVEYRDRGKEWYAGANRIASELGQEFGVPRASMSGVLAALSPQMDWFKNVSLAERVANAAIRNRNTPWSDNMSLVAKKYPKFTSPKNKPVWDSIKGKTYADLETLEQKAMWIRAFDEANSPKKYRSVTPEGDLGDFVKTKSGEDKSVSWGGFDTIKKAVIALESNGDFKTLSDAMGTRHKVRNFFNNIEVPYSDFGDITVDTHAIAAAYMRPLSGSDDLTVSGLGMKGGSSSKTGSQGMYGLIADSYRDLAKDYGYLPREMQSITWEAVRGLFPPEFKTPKNKALVDSLWKSVDNGAISQDVALKEIEKLAGGFTPPSWLTEKPLNKSFSKGDSTMRMVAPIAGAGLLGAGMMRQEEQQPQQGILN